MYCLLPFQTLGPLPATPITSTSIHFHAATLNDERKKTYFNFYISELRDKKNVNKIEWTNLMYIKGRIIKRIMTQYVNKMNYVQILFTASSSSAFFNIQNDDNDDSTAHTWCFFCMMMAHTKTKIICTYWIERTAARERAERVTT